MTQLTKADLAGISPAEIDTAHNQGRLDLLLGRAPEYVELVERAAGVINRADMAALRLEGRDDLIAKAHEEDRIDATNQKDIA
jgi:hypothetical protein